MEEIISSLTLNQHFSEVLPATLGISQGGKMSHGAPRVVSTHPAAYKTPHHRVLHMAPSPPRRR